MPKAFGLIVLTLFWLLTQVGLSQAYPITTKYYSVNLPANWSVLQGPKRQNEAIFLQIANQKKTATATLVVGKASPKEAQDAPYVAASRVKAYVLQNQGQSEFSIAHGPEKGFCLFRYDPKSSLLLVLTISGALEESGFLFKMNTPYPKLRPVPPLGLKLP